MAEENIYGRKVFFINSTYEFKKYVIPALQKEEYEAYILDSYKDAKNILRHNPESFLFILINSDLSLKGWFNFIKSIENDPELNKTVIGVIGDSRIKEEEKKMFITGSNLQGGFYTIGIDKIEKITEDIISVLELNKAKGRRQFVRATCIQDKEAKMFWTFGGKMHMFQLLDISSVGMAAIVPPSAIPFLKKDGTLGNVSLLLDGRQYSIEIKLFNIAQRQSLVVGVFMINSKTTEVVTIDAIRKYISATLFTNIQKQCYGEIKDNINYNSDSSFLAKKDDNDDKGSDGKTDVSSGKPDGSTGETDASSGKTDASAAVSDKKADSTAETSENAASGENAASEKNEPDTNNDNATEGSSN